MGGNYLENPRKHGKPPFSIALIHGGPGASGEMAYVARELSPFWGVLEPFQTHSSIEGLLKELKEILNVHGSPPITLVGHSWGAWLAFIFTAKNPSFVDKLILIGSGPFEERYAEKALETRMERLDDEDRIIFHSLNEDLNDPLIKNKNEVFRQFGNLMRKIDSYDLIPFQEEEILPQYDIFKSIWKEADELRRSGILLNFGKNIKCPVVAIHGDYDPHPPEGVREPLSRILEDFRFIPIKECGHYPWLERPAKDRFYEILKGELR
jgi:pimeloyl-ACP methyl ester carboxylesterase